MLINFKPGKAARRISILGLCFLVMGVHGAFAQAEKASAPAVSLTEAEQEVIKNSMLSRPEGSTIKKRISMRFR
jgi:hypothetical protein